MYVPEHFEETRIGVLHDLMRKHPLGVLCTSGQGGLDANHIPFLLDAEAGSYGVLHAHVARANPVWRQIRPEGEGLVIFSAEDAYISPSWYPSKHEFHRQVPTWNYRVVHARGRITVRDDERYVRWLVARLTQIHEASELEPWKMGDSPKDYIDGMLAAIVGIEVEITRLVGKFKLSQNREARDIEAAAGALKSQGNTVLAEAMLDAAPGSGPERGS
ncbi:MAG TPA: FMN-binding negative transcriptional regulator [Gammaproteobacteria bacterium]|nr:FMN-binding negative transcriptional regulator [Gammaproteobacteria bacterium]